MSKMIGLSDAAMGSRRASWDFAGSGVVISGASSGIGLVTAQQLVEAGARVYGFGTSPACPEFNVLADGGNSGSRYLCADVRHLPDLQAVRDVVESDLRSGGMVMNTLVVNAGVSVRREFLETPPEELRRAIDVNLYGAMLTLQVFVPLLIQAGGGSVVVMSSIVHNHGMRLRAAYGATKGGLAALVKALAVEWGPSGVRINAVAPGLVTTDLVKAYALENPERKQAVQRATPLGRLAEARDIADTVIYLLSDASRHISGEIVAVDGGFTAGSSLW